MKIGIDIGRVIIKPAETHHDTSFLSGSDADAMRTPPSEGAFDAIRRLYSVSGGRIWLVSKCGARVEARSRAWLAHWRFTEHTGVTPDRFRFCKKRPDKAIIARELGLEAFIDDRVDIARHLGGVVEHRLLFGPQKRGTVVPAGVEPVADWADVLDVLLPRVAAASDRKVAG